MLKKTEFHNMTPNDGLLNELEQMQISLSSTRERLCSAVQREIEDYEIQLNDLRLRLEKAMTHVVSQ